MSYHRSNERNSQILFFSILLALIFAVFGNIDFLYFFGIIFAVIMGVYFLLLIVDQINTPQRSNELIAPRNVIEELMDKKRLEEKQKKVAEDELILKINSLINISIKRCDKYGFEVVVINEIDDVKLYGLISGLEIKSLEIKVTTIVLLDVDKTLSFFPHIINFILTACPPLYSRKHVKPNLEINTEIKYPLFTSLTFNSFYDERLNFLISNAENLKTISFYKCEAKNALVKNLQLMNEIKVLWCIGIPKMENLPKLEILYMIGGVCVQKDFENIKVYNLKNLYLYDIKNQSIPKNFDKFGNLRIVFT